MSNRPAEADGATVVHVMTVPLSLGFLRGQPAFMAARGLRLQAVTSPGPELARWGAEQGVPVHAVLMPRRISPLQDVVSLWRLVRLLRRLRPDIVHAHTPKGGLLGMIAAWLAGVPARLYHIRGLPYVAAVGPRRRLLTTTERISCALAHRVLAVSHSMRDLAIADGLCPAGKVAVLAGGSGNGVDAGGRFQPQPAAVRAASRGALGIPEQAPVIGFVGRLVRDKGIGELATAWASLRDRIPEAHLLLVGPLEPEDPLDEATAAALRADPRVHLVGVDLQVVPYYAAMDLLVLPTYREGFPNVVLEASAMALPVVATRVPGCVDAVVDKLTGVLVPARDAAALAHALEGYLRDPTRRQRDGQRGRDRVLAEFRQEVLWAALADEYHRLLQAARAR